MLVFMVLQSLTNFQVITKFASLPITNIELSKPLVREVKQKIKHPQVFFTVLNTFIFNYLILGIRPNFWKTHSQLSSYQSFSVSLNFLQILMEIGKDNTRSCSASQIRVIKIPA